MPELAEVAYYAKQWDAGLGQRVETVHLHAKARVFRDLARPESLKRVLLGKCYTERRTHGKRMYFRVGDVWLSGHLGMTGKLWCADRDYQPEKHDHLVLCQGDRKLVFTDPRMFGHWQKYDRPSMNAYWESLPPEVTDSHFTKIVLSASLKRRARSPLKAVLLDQEIFPGVGNWMADEILWRCHLDPRRLAGSLKDSDIALL